jgi:hypothetical protein
LTDKILGLLEHLAQSRGGRHSGQHASKREIGQRHNIDSHHYKTTIPSQAIRDQEIKPRPRLDEQRLDVGSSHRLAASFSKPW